MRKVPQKSDERKGVNYKNSLTLLKEKNCEKFGAMVDMPCVLRRDRSARLLGALYWPLVLQDDTHADGQ